MLTLLLFLSSPAFSQDAPDNQPTETPADAPLPIVTAPTIVEYIEAVYPPDALEQSIEATVRLRIELDETGAVKSVAVIEPVGNGFDEAAVAAVQQMTFTPAATTEGPVPVIFEFAYGFVLKPDPEPPPESQPKPVNLDGTIIEMGTRKPVEGAQIVLMGTELTAETDASGFFEFRGVPAGPQAIRVLHPDYVTLTEAIDIVDGEKTQAKLWVRNAQYRDNEVVGIYRPEKKEITRRTLSIQEVKRIPGTFGDPVKVIQTLPGAARSPFGSGLLLIRGANPEDSGVYVDGIRIPIIYHLTGTTSVLQPDIIDSVDYLPGGYGAQYGRTMGGVVDVKTKSKIDDTKLTFGSDILDSQVYFQSPLGKDKNHAFMAGFRRSYIDLFIPIFTGGTDFTLKPIYWDYQTKYLAPAGADEERSIFVYGFNDLLEVATPKDVAQGSDQDTQGDLRTRYGSHRVIGTWRKRLGDNTSLLIQPSLGFDDQEFGLGDSFRVQSKIYLAEIRAELTAAPSPAIELVQGIDFIGGVWSFDFKAPYSLEQSQDPLAEREDVFLDGRGTAWSPDAYLKLNLRPLKDRKQWLVVPSVRANTSLLTYGGLVTGESGGDPWSRFSLDPRLATRLNITKNITLKGASGLYHQPPQPFEAVGLGTNVTLQYERAWNSSFGIEHQVLPYLQWDLELFYRDLDQLIVFSETYESFGDQSFINGGVGRAYGMEFILRHQPNNRFFGWVSYTLSKSERKDSPNGNWYPFEYDQTHILSAQAGYDLPFDFGISGQIQYVTGNPTTPLNAGIFDTDVGTYNGFQIGGYNGERMPAFFQTSLRVDKLWTFKRWQLETYVDLLNIVRGVNPEFRLYNYDFTESAYVRGLPFIPNIGLEARFFL